MRIINVKFRILLILIAVLEPSYGQTTDFPLSLISEDIEYVRTETYRRRPQRVLRGMIPINIHHRKRDIYKITITVQVKSIDRVYSAPFAIQIIDSRFNEKVITFNRKRYSLFPDEIYTFQTETSFASEGFAKLFLGHVHPVKGIFLYDKFSPSITQSTIYINRKK